MIPRESRNSLKNIITSHEKGGKIIMARRRVVTKTVVGTKYEVLGLNPKSATPITKEIVLKGTGVALDKALKVLQKEYNNPEFAIATITNTTEVNTIYGMFEEKFIELAHPMTDERKFEDETLTGARDAITRTINATKYTMLAITVKDKTPKTVTYTLGMAGINPDKVLDILRKRVETNDLKVAAITGSEDASKILGLSEDEFIKNARIMDENRHFVGDDSDEIGELEEPE